MRGSLSRCWALQTRCLWMRVVPPHVVRTTCNRSWGVHSIAHAPARVVFINICRGSNPSLFVVWSPLEFELVVFFFRGWLLYWSTCLRRNDPLLFFFYFFFSVAPHQKHLIIAEGLEQMQRFSSRAAVRPWLSAIDLFPTFSASSSWLSFCGRDCRGICFCFLE